MGMAREARSLNWLSNELKVDRRTLAKRLEGLRPVKEQRVADRVERTWYLADVIAYLQRQETARASGNDQDAHTKRIVNGIKAFIATEIYPKIIDEQVDLFGGVVLAATTELGMSKADAMCLWVHVALSLAQAIGNGFQDPDMQFSFAPDGRTRSCMKAIHEGRLDEWIADRWPFEDGELPNFAVKK